MSKSDHSKRRIDRYNDEWSDRVTRRHHAAMPKREAIAEQLADMLVNGQRLLPGVIRVSGTRPASYDGIAPTSSYTVQTTGFPSVERLGTHQDMRLRFRMDWHEVALSDCEFGCKVYESIHDGVRERQVLHSSAYGCRDTDGPVQRTPLVRTVVRKRRRRPVQQFPFVALGADARELMRPGSAIAEAYEVPSLMQLASMRQG